MNYYERYIGDYQRDTAHLSLAEHGAYTMLLDTYYATEKALPADYAALCRICRAFGAAEQKAVKAVADQFFPVGADGLRHNAKCDEIIPDAQKRIAIAQMNGGKGGRPRKNKTEQKPSGLNEGNPAGFETGTQQGAQPQSSPTPTPLPTNPSSAVYDSTVDVPDEWWKTAPLPAEENQQPSDDPAVALAVALRKLQVNVTAIHPTLLDWVAKGVTLKVLTEAVQLVRMRPGKETGPINPNYLATVLAGMQNPQPAKAAVVGEVKGWWESASGIRGKGAELGLVETEEVFSYYRDRVFVAAGNGPWNEKVRVGAMQQGFQRIGEVVAR